MSVFDGSDGNDTIIGTDGDDVFHLSKGQDILSGRGGIDTLIADLSLATTSGAPSSVSVDDAGLKGTIRAGELGAPPFWSTEFLGMEHVQITTGATNDGFYLTFDRTIAGYTIEIDGGAGLDYLDLDLSLGQHAALVGDAAVSIGNSSLTFRNIEAFHLSLGSGNDDLTLVGGDDTVKAGQGNDRILGMGGNDMIEGQWGGDYLDGGAGNDKLYAYDAYIGVDDGSEIDTLIGGAGDDLLSFGYGDNADGGTGTDRLSISLRSATAGAVLDLTVLFAGGTITLGGGTITGFEAYDVIYGTDYGDTIITGDAPNVGIFLLTGIQGFGGDDAITTGSRADTVSGGLGNDIIHSGGDQDRISGDEGNDILYADAGNDTVFGGDGNDEIHGGADNDTIQADAGIDQLFGDGGNDSLRGGTGADMMNGGAGDDTYYLEDGDTIVEAVGGGFDTVYTDSTFQFAATNFALSAGAEIEVFAASGNSNIVDVNLTGNEFGQRIVGNIRNNILDGGGGADTLVGGQGNDIYIVDVTGDVVTENAGEGTDEIRTALSSYSLAALPNVENLTGTSNSGQTLTGNTVGNVLRGGGGNDVLDGASGADTMIGGGGNDLYLVDQMGDTVTENAGEGTDEIRTAQASYSLAALGNVENLTGTATSGQILTGNAANNFIIGSIGNDALFGADGSDILIGGRGLDRLTGGAGADTFVFASVADSLTEAFRSDGGKFLPDIILDFTAGQDRIDLSQIDAVAGTAPNDAFTFIGGAAFGHHAGELRFEARDGWLHIYADVDGDGLADMQIVAAAPTIQASDFIL